MTGGEWPVEVFVDAHEVTDLAHEILHHTTTVRGLTRAAVHKTGYDCLAHMQAGTPVDTGHLRATESVDFDGLSFEAGPTAEYGLYVEMGVPHPFTIRARDGGMLRFVIDGREVFARQVVHPPSAPQPYAGPAFDRVLPGFEDALGQIGAQVIAP